MKFSELKNMAAGIPDVYAGYVRMKADEVSGVFTIDGQIIIRRTPKVAIEEDGTVAPVVNRNGEPVDDRLLFLPINCEGIKVIVLTKSPLLIQLFRNLETVKTEPYRSDSVLEYKASDVEGKFRFIKTGYKYGERTLPVADLQEVE